MSSVTPTEAVRSGFGGVGTASAGTASGCGSGLDAAGSTDAAGVGRSRSVAAGTSAATGCEAGPGVAVRPEVAAGTAAESSGEGEVVVGTSAAPTWSGCSDPTGFACTVSTLTWAGGSPRPDPFALLLKEPGGG